MQKVYDYEVATKECTISNRNVTWKENNNQTVTISSSICDVCKMFSDYTIRTMSDVGHFDSFARAVIICEDCMKQLFETSHFSLEEEKELLQQQIDDEESKMALMDDSIQQKRNRLKEIESQISAAEAAEAAEANVAE
jgi:uncharacterized UPF0160 family protein